MGGRLWSMIDTIPGHLPQYIKSQAAALASWMYFSYIFSYMWYLSDLQGALWAVKFCTNYTSFRQFFLVSLIRMKNFIIWAPSSEFVSSSILSWQILTAHAQPFRGARDLAFCLKVPLDSLLVRASSEGSGETARMRRLAWTFAVRIGYKYQIHLTRSISSLPFFINLPEIKGKSPCCIFCTYHMYMYLLCGLKSAK